MKKIVMIFAAMAAVLSSCQKSELESVSANDGKDIVLNISVSNPGVSDTKALIKTGWAANDEISIWYDSNVQENPDLVITYNGTKWIQKVGAAVSGNTPSQGENKYAKALYNGTVKVASKDNYTYDGTTLTFSIANWVFLTEVQVVVKDLTSDKAGDYTLACDKFTPLASSGNGYIVSNDAITASAGTKGTAVTGISNTDGVAFVFATADYSSSSTDKKDFAFTLKDNTSGSTKVYKPNVAIEAKTNKSSIKALSIESSNFKVPVPDGFVDLGLASGIFWAEKNLGASQPEEYGKYYSWGDVKGQMPSELTFDNAFGWDNDVFGRYFDKVEQTTACPDGVLAQTYDVAYQTNNGRMPTKEDFTELAKQCFLEWTDNYNNTGVKGVIVWKAKGNDAGWFKPSATGKGRKINDDGSGYNTAEDHTFGNTYAIGTDPCVFFPAAGYGGNTSLNLDGNYGYYWSSSLYSSNLDRAYYLDFSNINVRPQYNIYRYRGLPVRPVSD